MCLGLPASNNPFDKRTLCRTPTPIVRRWSFLSLHLTLLMGIVPDEQRTRWTRHVGDAPGLRCGGLPPFFGEATTADRLLIETTIRASLSTSRVVANGPIWTPSARNRTASELLRSLRLAAYASGVHGDAQSNRETLGRVEPQRG